LSKDGHFRAVCVKNSTSARTAQTNHHLSHFQAGLLGRALSSASLLSSFLKGEERIIIELEGNGPISKVFAEALQLGEVRGYVNYNKTFDFESIQSISELLGIGVLKVSKVMYNKREPIMGIVPLMKGDVSSDITEYFSSSEQIPSIVILDVSFDETGIISQSGGLIVQAMPGFTTESLKIIYNKLMKINKLTQFFDEGLTPLEVLKQVLPFEFDLISSSQLDFFCRCSKESFLDKLMTLDLKDIEEMKENNENELVCQYCNTHYYIEEEDFDKIITEMRAKRN
jgi:molecular chaperone Hsp33